MPPRAPRLGPCTVEPHPAAAASATRKPPLGLALALALLGGGCAAAVPPLRCPLESGRPWSEIRTAHFVVQSDLPPAEARDTAQALERRFALLGEAAFPGAAARPTAIEVVVMARREDYRALAPPKTRAFTHVPSGPWLAPAIVTWGPLDAAAWRLVHHELAHRLVRQLMPQAPHWLDEGLAEYHSTLRLDGGAAVVGEPDPCLASLAPQGGVATRLAGQFWECEAATTGWLDPTRLPSLRTLLDADAVGFDERHYHLAGTLVHLLDDREAGYGPRFANYLTALQRGQGPKAAWRGAFGEADERALGRALRQYVQRPLRPTRRLSLAQEPSLEIRGERALRSGDVHLLWARLLVDQPQAEGVVRSALAGALAEGGDPTTRVIVEAAAAGARQDFPAMSQHFQALLAQAPTDERLLLGLATSRLAAQPPQPAPVAPELDAVMLRLARSPELGESMALLARYRARRGEAELALPLATRAVERDPRCASCLATLAGFTAAAGRHEEAWRLQQRAVNAWPERPVSRELADQLGRYRIAAAQPGEGAAIGSDPNLGYLTIQAEPWARIVLDGKDLGRTTPLLRFPTAVGRHTVELRSEGSVLKIEVELAPKRLFTIDERLD